MRVALVALLLCAACQEPHAPPSPRKPEMVEAGPGAVDGVVRGALVSAHRDGRQLLVYVSATWCQPCERFQAALRAGELDPYFPDLRLLKFDQDRDGERLAVAGYDGQLIPRFVVPATDGRGTAQRVEGGTKATDTVRTSIGPRLQQLLGMRPSAPRTN